MGGLHIAFHASSTPVIYPFRQRFDDVEGFALPGKSIRAGGRFFQHGRHIEMHLDGLVDEFQRVGIHFND